TGSPPSAGENVANASRARALSESPRLGRPTRMRSILPFRARMHYAGAEAQGRRASVNAARTARELVDRWVPSRVANWLRRAVEHTTFPADMAQADVALYRRVAPFTMTSPERVIALRDAVVHVCELGLPGDFVECGVWRGGSMMVVAEVLAERGQQRMLHLFD